MANQLSARKDFGIELSDVTAYHPAATAQAPPAIQGLSLSIGPGEHVAVIGPSGSGKTLMVGRLAHAGAQARGVESQVMVSFADQPDAFINLNSPAELAAYEARLLAGGDTP